MEMGEVWANNNTMNITLQNMLLETRGHKHLPHGVVMSITVILALIFLSGVVGNVAVCRLAIRKLVLHTATDYYLFSQAISHLMLLLVGKSTIT